MSETMENVEERQEVTTNVNIQQVEVVDESTAEGHKNVNDDGIQGDNDNVIDMPDEQKSSSVLLTEGSFVAESMDNDKEKNVSEDAHPINNNMNVNEVKNAEQISQQTVSELKRTQDAAVMETLSDKLDNISVHEEEEDKEPAYMTPIPDPYARAIKYMEFHNVMQIFQKLTAEIIYHRPDDPLTHMLGELQKMKKERESNPQPTTLE